MVAAAPECDAILYEKLRNLLPPLTDEEQLAFADKELGFEGFSQDGRRHAVLIPTPISPHFWLWGLRDLALQIEEYSPRATACSRIPWARFQDVAFTAKPMEAAWAYPAAAPQPKQMRPTHLYVIQSAVGGPVKIGKSHDPETRAVQLQAGSPFPLRVVRVYERQGGAERAVHDAVNYLRLHGEWFDESAVEAVDAIMAKGGPHDLA